MFIMFINIIFTIHHLHHLLHHHCYHHHLNHLHHPQSVSLIARVTSVKSSIGIITHHQSSQSVSQWPTSRVSGDARYSICWVFLALHHKLYLCICTASRQVPPQTSARPYKCQHGYNKWHLSSWLAKILFSSLQNHFTIFSQPNGGMCCDCNWNHCGVKLCRCL